MRRRLFFQLALFSFSLFAFPEKISFRSDYMTGRFGDGGEDTKLFGNAYVKTEAMEISADEITLSGDNFRYINAVGNVVGNNRESRMDFTCGSLKYDRTTKIAFLEDSVHLIDMKNGMTADAQMIEYNQDKEIAVMQMNVRMTQKKNVCTCAYAVYKKNAQMLEMSGNPKIVQDGDTFRAQEITLNLDTQEITLDGRVQGTVTDTKSEKDEGAGAERAAAEGQAEPAESGGGEEKP